MEKKIYLFTEDDMNTIKKNLDDIVEKAKIKQVNTLEPTIIEYKKVLNIILDFLKKEKRIVYGGYGWNLLLQKKDPSSCFYKETDYADIEFYSNKPVEDLKELCDILHKSNTFVQGRNAQHDQTYKIFVNFINYCDITYMPSNLFINVKTINIDKIRIIDPIFIYIDILRTYTEPLTSYFRLEKNIKRGSLLFKNYPIEFNNTPYSFFTLPKEKLKIIQLLIDYLINSKTIIFIGDISYNIYNNNKYEYPNTELDMISTNLLEDTTNLYNLLFKYYKDTNNIKLFEEKIKLDQYYKFFQFLDKKIIFKFEGLPIITLYGHNDKCIPYNEVKINCFNDIYTINIGSFNICLLYNLIFYYKAITDNNNNNKKKYETIILNSLIARSTYFINNNKTILDDTIYKDFFADCIGHTVDFIRQFHLNRNNKKKRYSSLSIIPSYDPDENKSFNPNNYSFDNISGNIINNPKDKIYKIKHN